MSVVVDLHPEELLDKELVGELTTDEQARLDAHLASCAACRFERSARDDFRLEFASESKRAKLGGMVTVADDDERDEIAKVMARVKKPLVSRRARVAVMLAAAVLFIGGIAGAGWSRVAKLLSSAGTNTVDMPSAPASAPSALSTHARLRGKTAPQPIASDEPIDEPSPIEATPDPAEPSAVRAPPHARPHFAGPTAPSATATTTASSDDAPAPERTASTVFADANAARGRGDYGAAMTLYSEIESRFAGTPEAKTTLAILGRLALDSGDAASALRWFDAYLANGGGSLGEEAMVGRATALGRLGRTSEEAAAWSALLATYPGSAHAARARARLAAIGGK
jgi:TolA-binding protein